MSYLVPSEFVTKMVDAGESKIFMSTRDTVIRAYMAGAILALAAWFAVTINVNTGQPLVGALLFPVGFCMLYLLGFDLLTGVFVLSPLALIDKRPGVTLGGVLRNWGLVFVGNFAGALTVAFMMAFVTTFGFTQDPDKVGTAIGNIGEARTLGYAAHGAAGMATLFIRGMLCNWMVSTGVVGAMISTTVPGKVIAMWMPILVFFYMVFEHSVVNMFLFPSGLMLHAKFSIMDYFIWNEIPTVLGNLVGGLAFTGLTLYATHVRTAAEARGRQGRADPHCGLIRLNKGASPDRVRLPFIGVTMSRELQISIGQHSDKGRKPINQDFHGVLIPAEPLLSSKGIAVVLADGISSSNVSHIASESAVKSFLTDYYCTSESWSVKTSAQRVLAATNSWLHAQTRRSQYAYDKDKGYVCTLSAMVIKSTTAHIFHVGDCRIYRVAGTCARAADRRSPRHRLVGTDLSRPGARHQSADRNRLPGDPDRNRRHLPAGDRRRLRTCR